ncbi:MAG: hypothetical protein IPL89_13275 [Acidobacteria bacterium]|nr:hypothetical protein [Acidobacteriota bacterium]
MRLRTPLLSLLFAAGSALGNAPAGFGLEVLVDGSARPEYAARGTVYVEALRGRDFSLRITNPLGVRVAVALSVDGLNTIDARHTTARDARKWILDPYQTVVIPGWQVSGDTSRKFYFTGEKRSYGAALGQTANLGTIEAVFFREKQPYRDRYQEKITLNERGKDQERSSSSERGDGPPPDSMPAPSAAGALGGAKEEQNEQSGMARDHSKKSSSSSLSDELAATGIGRRTRFDVTRVDVDLEDAPAMSVRLRYEFRPQLVALGVMRQSPDPVARREAGRGFSDFCPEPN